jgi:acetylornithine deacetylase/succinyl-diaminopimelate desuccinylase-like protein
MNRVALLAGAALWFATSAGAVQGPNEARFREIYRELVETNTTLSVGSCTAAAAKVAARLKSAGFPDSDINLLVAPEHPKEGSLGAVLPGRDAKAKAILLLAHLDTVEAKREDWIRDPFVLVEENGNFYARGASDDKAQAAIWIDTLLRFHEAKQRPRRTLKMALTCGEETIGAFNGAEWLAKNQRELIDAQFALNEGAGGELDEEGNRVLIELQAGEKISQHYRLEVTNKGGHSSRPVKDNAIYHLAGALTRISQYEFPAQFTDANRAYFAGMGKVLEARGPAEIANAMRSLAANPNDAAAIALVSASDPSWNGMLRTTCVATLLDAGHAPNALPQRARATVNCRIFPGVDQETIRDTLEQLISDPAVKVTTLEIRGPASPPPPLTRTIVAPLEKLAAELYPGTPVVPMMQPGATDAVFLTAAGIPTYGIGAPFVKPDLGNIHGLNEYVSVESLMEGREFLFRLINAYAEAK